MKLESITWQRMAERLAGHLDARAEDGTWQRVGIDGAPAADTGVLAEELAGALRGSRGRAVLVVAAGGS